MREILQQSKEMNCSKNIKLVLHRESSLFKNRSVLTFDSKNLRSVGVTIGWTKSIV
jgi:hypothetical protein